MLDELPTGCADVVVTSPPYLGLRDYGSAGPVGIESAVDTYVSGDYTTLGGVRSMRGSPHPL